MHTYEHQFGYDLNNNEWNMNESIDIYIKFILFEKL